MVKYHNWWSNPDTERWFEQFFGHLLSNFSQENSTQLLHKLNLFSAFGHHRVLEQTTRGNINIVFIGENTKRPEYKGYDDDQYLSKHADLVLGFKQKPNGLQNIMRFPLWLTYIPYYRNFNIVDEHTSLCKQSINRPMKAILVCSHDRTGIRTKCISECKTKRIDVDIAGNWSLSNLSIAKGNAPKNQLLQQYAINVCPENSVEKGYTTEKVFQAIEAGCVPLYDGDRPVEPNVLNQQRIVYCNDMSGMNIIDLNRISTLSPYQPKAQFWIMKYYLEMWARVWYLMVQKGIQPTFNKHIKVHHYFIIPYRNRESNLTAWMHQAHKTYTKNGVCLIDAYDIILVEQDNNQPFNKGILLNIGFWKAMELHHMKYAQQGLLTVRPNLIFNDVDVFCRKIDHLRPEPIVRHPYGQDHCLGCIFMCSPEAYLGFNGFSNSYNGWGREDADALLRCRSKGINVDRTGHQQRNSNIDFVEFDHQANRKSVQANLAYYDHSNSNKWIFDVDGVNDDQIVTAAVDAPLQYRTERKLPYYHCKVNVQYQRIAEGQK